MRYLMDAVGEDAALFDDMNKPYAIAARDANDAADFLGDIFAATWRAKNIEACPYDLRTGGSHDALWETLDLWSGWAIRQLEWVKDQTIAIMRNPPSEVDGFGKNFVQDLYSLLDPNERRELEDFLNEKSVEMDWIDVLLGVPVKAIDPREGV